jgi:hypothetical protein
MSLAYGILESETRLHRDFSLAVVGEAPCGYPLDETADPFCETSFHPDYTHRREVFLQRCREQPAPRNFKAPFYELARLEAGGQPHVGIFLGACDYINRRKDCSDFVLHSLLRLLYQYPGRAEIPSEVYTQVRRTVLDFKYWPDEPGVDSLCTWTENHQILYASAGLLAGMLYPHETFSNSGRTGSELAGQARARVLRWLDLREKTGFSEWFSHVYYDEDLTALLSLLDFCAEGSIRERVEALILSVLADIARHSFRGVFGSSHGRSYEDGKKHAGREATGDTAKLLFGRGCFSRADNMSSVCFVLSPRFHLPDWLYRLGNDDGTPEIEIRRKMGIRLAECERWGLRPDNPEDGMALLSLEAYAHPRTIEQTMRLFDDWRWWENGYFAPFARRRKLINLARRLRVLPLLARLAEKDLCRNTREEVDLYTYRTPDYMLSCAQDYRPGYGGDQQSIWQATLGPEAVCFTTHPPRREGDSPNYWTGSGTLPRAVQVKSALICIYNFNTAPGLYVTNRLEYTHAWLPKQAFDQTEQRGGWIFVRRGTGYLAITARNGMHWQAETGTGEADEVISPGKRNVWICQMGREAVDGSFGAFIECILAARLTYRGLKVEYHAPGVGELRVGWTGPLRLDGKVLPLHDYPRSNLP